MADNATNDEPDVSGLEHLQRAARELIAAARSVLDAAEELVDDPAAVQAVMSGVRTVVTAVARAVGTGTSDSTTDPGGRGPGIERIDVS